jgi:hypothetical protein
MAYYNLRIDIWCAWDPEESDFEDIVQNINSGDAICTRRQGDCRRGSPAR